MLRVHVPCICYYADFSSSGMLNTTKTKGFDMAKEENTIDKDRLYSGAFYNQRFADAQQNGGPGFL